MVRWLAVVVAIVLLPTMAIAASWPTSWQSRGDPSHPLVGQIWETETGRFVDAKTYGRALEAARFLLLGEIHDNADHHTLQAWSIAHMAAQGPGIVFEHFREDQQGILSAFEASRDNSGDGDAVDRLLLVTQWDQSGWPKGEAFRPLFEAVLGARLPLLAGNVARARLRDVARNGMSKISQSAQRDLKLDQPLSKALLEALLTELEASHCNLMPKSAFGGMADAQRLRDGFMARVMADAAVEHGKAVLVAGNGHVRKDRGVPWYLRRMVPDAKIVAVGHIEVQKGKTVATDYAASRFDYLVFTPRHVREDPCIADAQAVRARRNDFRP